MIEFLKEEDVVEEIDNGIEIEIIDKYNVDREYSRGDLYRKDIESNHCIEKWLQQIEDSEKEKEKGKGNGKIDVRVRYIRDNILREQLKNKPDKVIYSIIKDIVLEYGIDVKMRHHYGCILTMRKMNDNELKDKLKVMNKRKERHAEYCDKWYHDPDKGDRMMIDEDIYCPRYLGEIIEDKLLNILTESGLDIVSVDRWAGSTERKPVDWIYKTKGRAKGGTKLKIKQISSCIVLKNDGRGWEGEVFQWSIKYNRDVDLFVLTGWKDRESLDYPIYMWIIGKDEIVNDRKFCNRDTFMISTNRRSLYKYSKYEIKLSGDNDIRKDIRKNFEKRIREIKDERLEKILRWYKTYFR